MAEPKPPETPKKKSSFLPKIMISGFIMIIVVAETFIFFFMVPTADDVAALAEARLMDKLEASMANDGEEIVQDDANAIKEFPLGEYGVVFTPPGSDRSHSVEFTVFGTIKKKDEKRLEQLFEARKGRFRHRMLLEIRNATMDELTENQLGLIQRRILATSNEILEEPILLGVGFNDFQLREE